uniref:SAM domain-containing protein n=1 Tax=Romanomermis culicivorax TaxID=13658 RepID=A0A915JWE6_ROMCU
MSDVNGVRSDSKFFAEKNTVAHNYTTLMIGGSGQQHNVHSQQQQLSSTNNYVASGPGANAICSASSLWICTNSPMRHRNSTGSTSSHSSSGFESMRDKKLKSKLSRKIHEQEPRIDQLFLLQLKQVCGIWRNFLQICSTYSVSSKVANTSESGSQQHPHIVINGLRGDSPPSRNSIHSSSGSSSFGSLDRLDESSASTANINLGDMIQNGIPDHQIISCWLHNLHYEEYTPLFLNAGYDLATIARMTPEDLTAIGITKPGHRKRLTMEIHRMNIIDSWPDKKPVKPACILMALFGPELKVIYTCLFRRNGTDRRQLETFSLKISFQSQRIIAIFQKMTDGNLLSNRMERKFPFRLVTLCRLHSVPFRFAEKGKYK